MAKNEGVRVEFKGIISQEKLSEELNKSEIFILVSLSEGNPKVLLEAMSCGLSCIGSNIPSIKEIIEDGANGLLCQIDLGSICNSLLKLLNNDNLRMQMGIKARQAIIGRFGFEKIMEKELNLYE